MGTSSSIIACCNGMAVRLAEEILTDGSKVYSVIICSGEVATEIDCINREAAETLFTLLGNESDYFIHE